MSLKEYINKKEQLIIEEEAKDAELRAQLIEFFRTNKNPTDKDFHAFAETLGVDEHKAEEVAYSMLSEFWGDGAYEKNPIEPDNEQLEMGIDVEMEHTSSPEMARRIALDHLSEVPDYYTRLKKMEDDAKAESAEAESKNEEE